MENTWGCGMAISLAAETEHAAVEKREARHPSPPKTVLLGRSFLVLYGYGVSVCNQPMKKIFGIFAIILIEVRNMIALFASVQ